MSIIRTPFGDRIEQDLGRLGMTQQQFADHLGVSQQTISKWITGETTPRLRHLPNIEELLGAASGTISSLLFAQYTPTTSIDSEAAVPVTVAGLRRRLTSLTPEEVAKVAAYVDDLLHNRS